MSVRSTMDLGLAALTAPSESSSVVGVVAAVGAAVAGLAVLGVSAKNAFARLTPIWVTTDQADDAYHLVKAVQDGWSATSATVWYAARLRGLGLDAKQASLWGDRLAQEPTGAVLDVVTDVLLEQGVVQPAELLSAKLHPRPVLVVAVPTPADEGRLKDLWTVFAEPADEESQTRIDALTDKQFLKNLIGLLGSRTPSWMRAMTRSPKLFFSNAFRKHAYRGNRKEPCALGMGFYPPAPHELGAVLRVVESE